MATLTAQQVIPQFTTGGADLFAVYALHNVNTGDTIDVSTLGAPAFQVVNQAAVMSPRYNLAELAAFTGTAVTMPAGLTKGSGYLIVSGC